MSFYREGKYFYWGIIKSGSMLIVNVLMCVEFEKGLFKKPHLEINEVL